MRRDPERWTTESWAEVYSFAKEGRGQASRMDKFMDSKFSIQINPKDRHIVADCVDPRKRRVLEFVVPILYLEKPNRITMTVGNTIFGALSGTRKVSWGLIIQELVEKLISGLEKGKPSPISSYLFYHYNRFECLRRKKVEIFDIAKYCLEFGAGLEAEMQPDVVELNSDQESLNSSEQRKILAISPGSQKK